MPARHRLNAAARRLRARIAGAFLVLGSIGLGIAAVLSGAYRAPPTGEDA